jgi:hypothetical protein
MVYGFFGVIVVMVMASLAVDWGRMQVAKAEVQAAAIAAARAGGQKFMNDASMTDIVAEAISTARLNSIDGTSVTLRSGDIKIGVYFPDTKTFVETGDTTIANALRINLTHQFGRDGSPLSFIPLFSSEVREVTAQSTIMIETEGFDPNSYSYLLTTPGTSGGTPGTSGSTTTTTTSGGGGGGTVITEADAGTIVSNWTPPPPDPAPAPDPAPVDTTTTTTTWSTPDTTWSTPETTTVVTYTPPPPPPAKKMVVVN